MADPNPALLFCTLLFLLSHSAFLTAQLTSRAERVALLQLRSSLGLRSREWPIKSDPCSIWAGIQCINGSVTEINISGFKRTRIGNQNPQFSVEALANFTQLSTFNASKFDLPGQIPDWFGDQLIALQVLDVRSCSILGPIPSNLGNLTNLTALYLSGNRLTGIIPATLGQLYNLSILDLAQNSLAGSIPSSFGSLLNVTFLDLSSNFIFGSIPAEIGALFNLQMLNLSNNSLSSLIPGQLGDLSSLVDLDLSLNSLSGSVPQDLRNLTNLLKMVIGGNLLTGDLPGNLFPPLTQLQFIALDHNNFTGQIPNVLWSMPELRFLDASNNNFTGILPNPNPSFNSSAAVFNLSHNLLYGTLRSILTRFNFVDLSGNYFQGNIPNQITTNVSLGTNCLQNTSDQRTSAECSSFYTNRGLTFDNFGLPIPPPPHPPTRGKNRDKKVYILAGVFGGLVLIAVLVALLVLIILCCRKRNRANQRSTNVGPVQTGGASPSLPPGAQLDYLSLGESFAFQQILEATGEFSDVNLIKQGHSGDFFRGLLSGMPVVIKKIDLGTVKKESYVTELDFFSKVSHPRLVPFLGHCLEKENEKFLVYKYMPNGDLSSSLFWRNDTDDQDRLQSLDWITRLKIATGAAESLSYLHHECNPPLVHRDVQASSILLDDKYEVRLGSLSDVCAQEGDVHQSRITRFLRLPTTSEQGASGTHTATCTYDVYCFGKVLLELVTGKLGMSATTSGETSKDWMEEMLRYISIYDKELVTNIVDPTLMIDEDLLEEVWAMAVVARSCLNPRPSRRPLMRYIVKALENPAKVVREENTSSARLRATSSRSSWNAAALFGGSWRQSSSDAAAAAAVGPRVEGGGSRTTGSSRDIFPEPLDVERLHEY